SSNGFNSSITMSASGLPPGVTASFRPAVVTPPSNGSVQSTLTLTAASSAVNGTYNLTVTGTSGSLVRSTNLALTVNGFSVALSPASGTIQQGANGSSRIQLTRTNDAASVNFTVADSLSQVTGSASATTGNSSALTISVQANATIGAHTLTVTGN